MINDELEMFRNMEWMSGDGKLVPLRSIKVKDMTDAHIANVIIHIRKNPREYPVRLFHMFIVEAWTRNIPMDQYADGAEPTPFVNPVTESLVSLNEETQEFVEV